jgi:hypothetical protein
MRGVGKTYAFKKWAIKDFLRTGAEFVYVRRYKTEIGHKDLRKFFTDISSEYPEVKLEVKGTQFFINEKYAGQAIALSTAKILKSVPFPNVNKICFDEFILDKGAYHYLPDEVTNFLELYSTIARLRDVRVVFLSNALTVTNPYFDYFNVKMPFGNKTVARTGDEILVEVIKEAEYTQTAKKTRFGQIIDGTGYGAYAMENEFYRDNKNFVQKKTPGSEYYFTVRYCGDDYGVWVDYKEGLITISRDIDPSNPRIYALTNDDHAPNALLMVGPRAIGLQTLSNMYAVGAVRFESVGIKNAFIPAIRMITRR